MPSVTVLGQGPMGRALATSFLAAGHETTVWNRTPGRAGAVVAAGAREAGTVADAVAAGSVVVACLLDYAAVAETLEQARSGWDERVLVNLTSGDPEQARHMAAQHPFGYLDGAILTPTPSIGTPAATVLYSGDPTVHATVEPMLAAIGGTAVHVGADPGRANAYDVALLDLFAAAVHGIAHAFAMAAAEDIPATALAPFATGIGALLPEMITRQAAQIDAGVHPGDRSTIASAGSAISHVIAAATRNGLDTGALTAAKALIDRAVADGHGADGLSYLTTAVRR